MNMKLNSMPWFRNGSRDAIGIKRRRKLLRKSPGGHLGRWRHLRRFFISFQLINEEWGWKWTDSAVYWRGHRCIRWAIKHPSRAAAVIAATGTGMNGTCKLHLPRMRDLADCWPDWTQLGAIATHGFVILNFESSIASLAKVIIAPHQKVFCPICHTGSVCNIGGTVWSRDGRKSV